MKILIVEDENISRQRLEKILKDMEYEFMSCKDGLDAWEIMQSNDAPNLIILDWMIPGMSGVELCRKVRELPKELYTYIVLLTSKDKVEDIVEGMVAGADGYITKPFNTHELKVRLKAGIRIVELNKESLAVRKTLQTQAIYDELTNLHNRRYMTEILKKEFARFMRHKTHLSCLLLDVDFFKSVNDNYGHNFGDLVLKGISDCIRQSVRKEDFAFRYGGEEFMILLPSTDINGALGVAEKTRSACEAQTYDNGTSKISVTVSIGIASVSLHQPQEETELVSFADKALYRAKAEGRNRVKVYMDKSSEQSTEAEIGEGKDVKHLKENISSLLEKTKQVSVESLELMVRDMCDSEYRKQSQEVRQYIELIGEKLCLPPSIVDTIKRAANLHDNFKILIEKSMKNRKKVLDKEVEANHPYMMADITKSFDFFSEERNVLMSHHENYDGSGYPEGLSSNEIPLGARIYTIADAIAAMLSEQYNKKSLSPEKVIETLADNAGSRFDPMIVSMFLDVIEEKKILSVSGEILTKAKEMALKAL